MIDTTRDMASAYIVATVIYVAYALSLWLRFEAWEAPKEDETQYNRRQSLQKEQPLPAPETKNTVEIKQGCGQR